MRAVFSAPPVVLAALAAATLFASRPAAAETIAIENATVHVAPGKTLQGATVLLEGGKVKAVGPKIAVPPSARRIDGSGKVVTAGLVDAWTSLGLVEVDLVSETNEGQFGPAPDHRVHAAYRVTDGYNPASVAIPIARAGGVTSAVAVPRGGLVAGTSAWMLLAEGASVESATVRAPLAMHVTLGEDVQPWTGGSRGLALEQLRELFDDAAAYARRKADYERNQSRPLAASRLDLEALIPVIQGRLPLAVTVEREADLRALLRLARDRGLRLIVVGGTEAWKVADELARARVPVVLNPTYNLPSSFDRLKVRDDAAAVLARAGVPVVLSTLGEASSVRTLRQVAGVAVAHGLPWEQALAAITSAPAQAFGIAGRGTLEPGAAADVVVWSGDPLELSTRPLHVFIGGVEQPLRTRQTLLFERYRVTPNSKATVR